MQRVYVKGPLIRQQHRQPLPSPSPHAGTHKTARSLGYKQRQRQYVIRAKAGHMPAYKPCSADTLHIFYSSRSLLTS
jgi:hypothetical protein